MSRWLVLALGLVGGLAAAGFARYRGLSNEQMIQFATFGAGVGLILASLARRLGPPVIRPKAKDLWAGEKLLSAAGLLTGAGIVLGKLKRRYVTTDKRGHALVIGASQSGKSTGVIIPSLLNWTESALIFDPKGELWQATSGWRSTISVCLRFDPTDKKSVCYNPLLAIRKGPIRSPTSRN